jgi:ArsR family transcriptional regulator
MQDGLHPCGGDGVTGHPETGVGFHPAIAQIPPCLAGLIRRSSDVSATKKPISAVSLGIHFAIPRNNMSTDSPLARLTLTTKTLGHPTRLRILAMLRHNRLSVCQIASALNVAPSTASGHLLELRRADLVTEQRRGKWVYYRLTDSEPNDALLRFVLVLIGSDDQVQQDAHTARQLNGTSPDVVCAAAAVEDALSAADGPSSS